MNICYDGYVLMFLYVDSTSVEHSSLVFRLWNGEVCIVCSHVNSCGRKNELLELLKGNMYYS